MLVVMDCNSDMDMPDRPMNLFDFDTMQELDAISDKVTNESEIKQSLYNLEKIRFPVVQT